MMLDLCYYRRQARLLQHELAVTLGLSQQTYSQYERKARSVPLNILMKPCDLYGCTMDELTGRVPPRPAPETNDPGAA
jgi:transcriptional regulator with XRE-family HTH domain